MLRGRGHDGARLSGTEVAACAEDVHGRDQRDRRRAPAQESPGDDGRASPSREKNTTVSATDETNRNAEKRSFKTGRASPASTCPTEPAARRRALGRFVRADESRLNYFFGCLTVTVLVTVFAAPPVGV